MSETEFMETNALPVLEIAEASNGQTVEAAVGQSVEICLEENPTTGFRWRMAKAGEAVARLLGDAFEPGRKAPGQAGVHRWQFKTVAAGSAPVRFTYRRSWEDDAASSRIYSVTLSVKK